MDMRILKAERITVENFRMFGTLVSSESRKPDADVEELKFWNRLGVMEHSGDTSVSIVETFGKNGLVESTLERHLKTGETLIPAGDIIIIAALSSKENIDMPDPDSAKAFSVKTGEAIIFAPGTWHHAPLTTEESVKTFVIFQADTPENDFFDLDLAETFGFNYKVELW